MASAIERFHCICGRAEPYALQILSFFCTPSLDTDNASPVNPSRFLYHNFWYSHLLPRGSPVDYPAISKIVVHEREILQGIRNIFERLRNVKLAYIMITLFSNSNFLKEMCFIGEITRFQPKNINIQMVTKSTILKIML